MSKIKKISKGVWGIENITIERIEEHNEHDTLVVAWELRKNDEWIEQDSFRTLREAKEFVIRNWLRL